MHLLNETGCVNEWCYGVHESDSGGGSLSGFVFLGLGHLF